MAKRDKTNRFGRRTLIGLLMLLILLSLLGAVWDWQRVQTLSGNLAARQARGLVQQIRRQIELTTEGDRIVRDAINTHLLSVADLIAARADLFDLSRKQLDELAVLADVDQLAILDPAGNAIVATETASDLSQKMLRVRMEDLLFDEDGILELGLYQSGGQSHMGLLVSLGDDALLVGTPASTLVQWRSQAGLTALFAELTSHPEVNYALVLSGDEILAATDSLPDWLNGEDDPFQAIALSSTEPVSTIRSIDGRLFFEVAAPLEAYAGVTLRLGMKTGPLVRMRRQAMVALFVRTLLFILLAGVLLAWFVIREHHAALQVEAARIRAEVERLEASRAATARLEAMGRLAGGVAHEIRNPLNTIEMVAQRLEAEFEPKEDAEEYSRLLHATREESRRIARIVQDFLEFARPPKSDKQMGDITTLLEEVAVAFDPTTHEKGANFIRDLPPTAPFAFDGSQIKAAVQNLLRNALEAVPGEGGVIHLNLREADGMAVIEVGDNGPGVPVEERIRIFHLYYTTKASGTGVGLALVHRIADEHGGGIEVIDNEPQGALFRMTLKREQV